MKNLAKLRSRSAEEYRAFRSELLERFNSGIGLSDLARIYGLDRRLVFYHLARARKEAR